MSNFRPFTYRLPNRNEPVIEAGDRGPLAPREPSWNAGDEHIINPWSQVLPRVGAVAGSVAGLGILGRSKFRGKRGWDYYHAAASLIEDSSPGGVLRTFQLSQAIAPFTSAAAEEVFLDAKTLQRMKQMAGGSVWIRQLEKTIGQDLGALGAYQQGIKFKGGQLFLGNTDKIILKYAFMVQSRLGTFGALQKGYIRSLLGKGSDEALSRSFATSLRWEDEFTNRLGKKSKVVTRKSAYWFAGGQTRGQTFRRFISGYGTALAERMNQLARAPFEMEPFASVFKKLPIRLQVGSASGLRTLAKLTGKLGIAGGVAYGAYSYLDYSARKSESLNETILAEGITAGIGTAWTRLRVGVAKVGEVFNTQDYVERQEQIAPRSTNISALLAFPLIGGFATTTGGYASRLFEESRLRRSGWTAQEANRVFGRTNQIFKDLVAEQYPPRDPKVAKKLSKRLERLYDMTSTEVADPSRFRLMEEESLERASKQFRGTWGKISGKLAAIGEKKIPLISRLMRKLGYMSPTGVKILMGIGVGFGLTLPFLPGALLPGQRSEELEAIYSGRKPVPIRKGRWWEFGRTAYEGENIMYYRPHWYPRMLARGRDKAIYGEEEMSPLEKFYTENFTYELEKKHYADRPYPITGTAFQDVPFIGPILAATIGRLIKPPRLMHTEEWMRSSLDIEPSETLGEESAVEYATMPQRYGYEEAPGEVPGGAPISPYGAKGIIGEQAYRMTEMIGLPGFSMGAVKEAITGEETLFAQETQLESAQRLFGAERAYWDLEVGGGLGATEIFRRLYPHRRREIPLYNPIRNRMPEWLPGPGERSPDFLHGDPYTKVQEGEIRLPGVGYAAFYSELEGVAPEDYPLVHKYKILADIAPYSTQFDAVRSQMKAAARKGKASETELAIIKMADEQLKARKQKKIFYNYQFKERVYTTEAEAALTAWNEAQKEQPSALETAIGSYWETIAHNAETPLDYMTPASPYNKLLHVRTALEDYESFQVYGTKNAFWGSPWRDFMRPFTSEAAAAVGIDSVPDIVQSKRDTEEYFDMLKYVKYTGLERQAQIQQDTTTAEQFSQKRRETLFGVNPYTYNYSQIFRSLPRRERDYFNEFVKADLNERQRLLEILPDNEKKLYLARWELEDAANVKKATKKGLLTAKQTQEAQDMIDSMYESKRSEGMPVDKQLWTEYLSTRLEGESYADWYRRVYLLAEQLEGRPLPGPDWIGWHPMVNLDDIKLKVVQGRGENPIDYDIWPDQERQLARRPSVAAGAGALQGSMSKQQVRQIIMDILRSHGLGTANVSVTSTQGSSAVDLNISHDRSAEIASIGKRDNLN